MLAFLESLSGFIQSVVNFVVSIFNGLIRMIRYIRIAVTTVTQVIAYIPTDLAILAAAFISVSVVYLIIGRQ